MKVKLARPSERMAMSKNIALIKDRRTESRPLQALFFEPQQSALIVRPTSGRVLGH